MSALGSKTFERGKKKLKKKMHLNLDEKYIDRFFQEDKKCTNAERRKLNLITIKLNGQEKTHEL